MGRLDGKTALVTGGNSGIGLATAQVFVREGARIAITGRNPETLEEARRTLGGDPETVQVDVKELTDLDRMYARIKATLGGLDVIFANAGIGEMCPLEEFTEAVFDEVYDINVKGVFFTVQKALPLLNSGASIILNSSTSPYTASPGFSAYGSSKAAVRALGRHFAADLVSRDVRVNVITPGPIRTPIWYRQPGEADEREEMLSRIADRVPMGRFGEPAEVAETVLFLASDDSSYMTGGELKVDGGIVDLPAAAGQKRAE